MIRTAPYAAICLAGNSAGDHCREPLRLQVLCQCSCLHIGLINWPLLQPEVTLPPLLTDANPAPDKQSAASFLQTMLTKFTTEDLKQIAAFHEAVNMTAAELKKWLETEESLSVGQKTSEQAESTGHQSGRNIIKLLRTKKHQYTADDIHEMGRIVSYVRRHLAQRPEGDVSETRWRYSLMNWGYDPLKK